MKTSFNALPFIFFIFLMLFACPLYSRAEEEASTQTDDIRIYEGNEIINVSMEDIKERILKGKPVLFAEDQEDGKRTIKAEWITNALKKEYGVERMNIGNAIITGDLDFHIQGNLVNIDVSGMDVDEIRKQKGMGVGKIFLISSSIHINYCQLHGNLKAGRDEKLRSFVIFKKSVGFVFSTVKKANFKGTIFNDETRFNSASFNGEANFGSAKFKEYASFMSAIFKENADFRHTKFKRKADFAHTIFKEKAYFPHTLFKKKADFRYAKFKKNANFMLAKFKKNADFSSANIEKAELRRSILIKSKLVDTNLNDANVSGINLTGSQYEPNSSPHKGSLGGIEGLKTVWFKKGKQSGLVQLRAALKESGLRDLEREATYAIEHWKAHWEPWYKRWIKHLLFEWTCGYGLDYLRPLLILLGLIVVFSYPYIIALEMRGTNGIWKVWPKERTNKNIGKEEPELLKGLRGPRVLGYAFYFSLLTAFHIGWRDLNVGSWISRVQPSEYVLKATGWVRFVSGVQSLISIYLLALWVLTQFGRPFD
jgi:uncharacterized protein YjbI with pentapeptide repeats